MDLTRFLSLLVLVTLIFAIARQLSEQTHLQPKYYPHNPLPVNYDDGFEDERKNIYVLPDSFGIPFANRGWDQGKR